MRDDVPCDVMDIVPRQTHADPVVVAPEEEPPVSPQAVEVLEAADGEEALRVFGANMAAIDLLLTDVVLPGKVRGRELSERVQALRPEVRVVFMSGYTENSIVHHARLDDRVHLVGKPFKREQLARKFAEVLGTAAASTPEAPNVVALRPKRDA
ncbi:response regulator [Methylorubrum extorquens]